MREIANRKRRHAVHERWAKALSATLPDGVPADADAASRDVVWPATFGDLVEGKPVHRPDQGQGYCFQCLHCRYYDPLESALGADWGACTSAASQYDRQVVFEHWTCTEYEDSGS